MERLPYNSETKREQPNPFLEQLESLPSDSARLLSKIIAITSSDFGSEQPKAQHTDLHPIIMDYHTWNGLKEVLAILQREGMNEADLTGDEIVRPFRAGLEECTELFNDLEQTPTTTKDVRKMIVDRIFATTHDISRKAIEEVFKATPLCKDIAYLSREIKRLMPRLERDARLIWNPATQKLSKYIGKDAHELLFKSRLLGIVPFETLRQLAKTEIHCAGASAVAESVACLVATGATRINFWDNGRSAPSNLPRFPAWMGGIEQLGLSKSHLLQAVAYMYNPYGNYQGFDGLVIPNEAKRTSPEDITFETFASTDIAMEVVHDPLVKTQIRLFMADNKPHTPLMFMADISDPIAAMEDPAQGNHFHQDLTHEEVELMSTPNSLDPGHVLTSVYHMLRKEISAENTMDFLAFRFGVVRFWSQPPYAANASADTVTREVLDFLQSREFPDHNLRSGETKRSFMPSLTPVQALTLRDITRQVFAFPTTQR
ncbi:hypothetical protein C5B42_05695 [Candidatus Cerribacteria bacterium 'Amazon FNV 2010 28 9']|uniref:Uncharacterized protein n=1 Tax=Candidatus Cerribacteria bacterium 'Amazon FNV 2010 28 9' TaxID=2081795 RepID=A0A317JNN2_9BACT|nr:MAG: hypothetical protein C5B42_05695 [Candidatus Cerribacteria bacterium 'Amazon FNV 2010 28 9']